MDAIDIVIVTHNRLDHLVRTLDALRQRTPEPFRITIVDNASNPDMRMWLAEHRGYFERIIPRSTNEHVPAFQHGIEATRSDPFIVTDPDLVVPDLRPSWLTQILDLLDRHPDFGLVGVDLDESNFPDFLTPDAVRTLRAPGQILEEGRLVEGNVGTHFSAIRRDALQSPYVSDIETCRSVRARGYRTGWSPAIQAFHLGFDDARKHPEYLRRKEGAHKPFYPSYWQSLEQVGSSPSLESLALAAPILDPIRRSDIPEAAIVELAWARPCLGDASGDVMTLWRPSLPLSVEDDSARAAVLMSPPPDCIFAWIGQACRLATEVVVLITTLQAVDGRLADEIGPTGWTACEMQGPSEEIMLLARTADRDPDVTARIGFSTLEHRPEWLRFFAAARGLSDAPERRVFLLRSTAAPVPAKMARVDRDVRKTFMKPQGLEAVPRVSGTQRRRPLDRAAGLARRLAHLSRRFSHRI
jgi:GT2 family glycosyltransferase